MDLKILTKAIRVITIAPVIALALLSILFVVRYDDFGSLTDYLLALFFLVLLPVLAYPLQPLIPTFKDKGRDGQRQFAMVMAVVGYVGGIITALCMQALPLLLEVYLTYLLSGLAIFAFNKLLHLKASGHACGIVGPLAILIYTIGWPALFGLIIVALVYWSSLSMKRHTLPQLLGGSLIPVCALLMSIGLVTLFGYTGRVIP